MQCLVIVYEFMSSPELNYSQLVKEDIPTKCFITFFFLSYLNFDFVLKVWMYLSVLLLLSRWWSYRQS